MIEDTFFDWAFEVENDNDYLLEWSIDTILEKIKRSKAGDDVIYAYDQHAEAWSKSACTLFAPLSVLSSLFNYKLSQEQLRDMRAYAKTLWYVEGKGYDSWASTKVACDRWNKTFPEMKAMYFWTQRASDDMYKALDHIKGVTTGYRGSAKYNEDRRDGRLDLISFWDATYWHRTTLYKVGDKYITYDSTKTYTTYEVPKENHKKYRNRHNGVYVFFPDKDFTPEEKKVFKDNKFSLIREKRKINRSTKLKGEF